MIASFSSLSISLCSAVSVKFITHYCLHVVCLVMGYVVLVDNLVMLLIVNL